MHAFCRAYLNLPTNALLYELLAMRLPSGPLRALFLGVVCSCRVGIRPCGRRKGKAGAGRMSFAGSQPAIFSKHGTPGVKAAYI